MWLSLPIFVFIFIDGVDEAGELLFKFGIVFGDLKLGNGWWSFRFEVHYKLSFKYRNSDTDYNDINNFRKK